MSRVRALAMVAALAAGACSSLPVGLTPPEVALSDVRYLGGSLLEQRFEFELRISNPNRQPLEIEGTSFTVDLNGRQFARGVSDQAFTIPGYAERRIGLPAVATLNSLIGQIANPGAATGLDYAIEGHVHVGGYGTLPFARKGRVGLPDAEQAPPPRGRF
ncbi:MAG: LEA type 2 family protein [Rhodocyclaceae bacterium]|nr:LEA type 2 family protein [Rhodocyclaceae bacterium]